MVNHHNHPDPAVAELISQSSNLFGRLFEEIQAGPESASADAPPAPELAYDPLAALAIVEQLCEQEDWRNALPVASHLFVRQSQNPRVAYLLASCLQRLGQNAMALSLYVHCTQLEDEAPTPGPLFRIGECLAALERNSEALDAFDASIELARLDVGHSDILVIASEKADALRALR
ncbi:type III secretion system chaperone protein SscB [Variovorax sp. PBL-H6]|uniref:CDC27 family protein n=1 Tax=Variovorax sp. PBL-H6 TaxID=434009 RepID=UPI0013178628|nr:CDC27 family protein [Variovorax sp. PBL-H6]VTU38381.1 type III secretion system chaperone protein SscB [Variovorax sp. PBL-H6]